ncbi:protein phosphatase 2C domain-containing protein [Cronbergia sp. UHCC 0137]|uniref:protein phosphatase 2C domain-containing protein n=1 Tax=Cronbergia sp. UHCC 0137 TaxID=3110239 RepID=UPI002B20062A|nr:protein phosphatase 2C domain-containing protein [Cronbergia sp. UHCC 0137]MEA5620163.1 protein phosphatase 2C domain-containing protein [Cronbergia sp. UHCC 0137]
MEKDAATTLQCPNEYCQAANPLNHKFCRQCSTPLPKRYLWAVGDGLKLCSPGAILADRYLVIGESILLDLKPGLLPQVPPLDDLSTGIAPYLKLITYRLNVPQLYGILSVDDRQCQNQILLLEKPPLLIAGSDNSIQLCTNLDAAWSNASSMRQIHWLWQLANLWQPLATEGVVSSLLNPNLLRVEGAIIRLLELQFDPENSPKLKQLGQFWQQWVEKAKPAIAPFIQQISTWLIEEKIISSEQLITVLDQGLAELGRSQTVSLKIITQTDTGPVRQRNEDACYPPSGVLVSQASPGEIPLAIVCDGIGGHEGGNVASNLAIETIQQQLTNLNLVADENIDSCRLINNLEQAVAIANDQISQRNDSENRHGRQRMGTTVVMALPIAHQIYITHVGDSRAYLMTHHGCYQVTLDDDVASREVRLGYATYREAIQQGSSGSLVQALGMSQSSSLHPTCQRLILDEDMVLLLTSDGLSDCDRVEEHWETEILPILTGANDLSSVAQKLIDIANTKNGHDNVTIALIHCQVEYSEPNSPLAIGDPANLPSNNPPKTILNQKTRVLPQTKPVSTSQVPWNLLVPLLLVIIAGSLGYWFKFQRGKFNPSLTTPKPTTRTLENLAPGWIIKTTQTIPLSNQQSFPAESYLQIIEINPKPNNGASDRQVILRACPPSSTPSPQENISINLSQLQRFNVSVLQSGESSSCQ